MYNKFVSRLNLLSWGGGGGTKNNETVFVSIGGSSLFLENQRAYPRSLRDVDVAASLTLRRHIEEQFVLIRLQQYNRSPYYHTQVYHEYYSVYNTNV